MKLFNFRNGLRALSLRKPVTRDAASSISSDDSMTESRATARTHIHQIYYSEETRRMLDPGFTPLDNTNSPEPQWREYYPIRKFLLNQRLDERCYYGFFAPKFLAKTNLTSTAVYSFIEQDTSPDVILFSPFCDYQAFFLNCFVQGEFYNPGLMNAAERFFEKIGIRVDVRTEVMDSRSLVFCNYFVAKPAFWRAWLDINEKLYHLSEAPGELHETLNAPTAYDGKIVPMKVFIMERVASLLLSMNLAWIARVYDPFSLSMSPEYIGHLETALVCDALKIAYRTHGYDAYMFEYMKILKAHSIPFDANK